MAGMTQILCMGAAITTGCMARLATTTSTAILTMTHSMAEQGPTAFTGTMETTFYTAVIKMTS